MLNGIIHSIFDTLNQLVEGHLPSQGRLQVLVPGTENGVLSSVLRLINVRIVADCYIGDLELSLQDLANLLLEWVLRGHIRVQRLECWNSPSTLRPLDCWLPGMEPDVQLPDPIKYLSPGVDHVTGCGNRGILVLGAPLRCTEHNRL